MAQIIPLEKRSYQQISDENDRLRVDAEISRQEIIRLNTENDDLRQKLAERDEQEAAIGAGGVSGKRITDDGTLAALQACERAYHQVLISGTPDNCYAHDKAREQFWRVFGGHP